MLAAIHWQYLQALPWVILVVAALSLLTLLIYPRQLRHIPRPWRWVPPALRILAMATIAISILRPVVTRPRTASEQGPVVLLLDDSRSMSVVDFGRPGGEWVAIAAAMGKLPPEARDKQTEDMQADCDHLSTLADDVATARAELDYARLSGRGSEAAGARLDQAVTDLQSTARSAVGKASAFPHTNPLERSLAYLVNVPVGTDRDTWLDRIRDKARAAAADAERLRFASDAGRYRNDASVRDACLPLQSLSRLQLAEAVALDPETGLLARLGPGTTVLGFGISDQVTPIFLPANGVAPSTEPLIADGTISNFTGGVREVLESLAASPPRAVVLFSDGRPVAADNESTTALQGVPIYTVGMAARSGMKDLSIVSASVVSSATIGDTITFRAEVRAVGLNGVTTTLTFTGSGPDETRPITFTDDRPVAVSFTRLVKSPGLTRLSLQITSVPGEASEENNRVERWINVSQNPIKGVPPPATRPAAEGEMIDLTGDEDTLRRLAESSGGQYLRLDQIDSLPKKLAPLRQDATHLVEVPLWDGVYVYALVLGCLTAEWGLRKRFGLA